MISCKKQNQYINYICEISIITGKPVEFLHINLRKCLWETCVENNKTSSSVVLLVFVIPVFSGLPLVTFQLTKHFSHLQIRKLNRFSLYFHPSSPCCPSYSLMIMLSDCESAVYWSYKCDIRRFYESHFAYLHLLPCILFWLLLKNLMGWEGNKDPRKIWKFY